jgi:hypothetical protein
MLELFLTALSLIGDTEVLGEGALLVRASLNVFIPAISPGTRYLLS